jgi:hypothetical protein
MATVARGMHVEAGVTNGVAAESVAPGIRPFYSSKLDQLESSIRDKTTNLRRLEAQRSALNTKGTLGCERKAGELVNKILFAQ